MKLHNLFHWIFPCTHRWFGCVAQRTQSKMWDTKNERARKTVINSSCFGASTSIFVRIKERECTHTHTHEPTVGMRCSHCSLSLFSCCFFRSPFLCVTFGDERRFDGVISRNIENWTGSGIANVADALDIDCCRCAVSNSLSGHGSLND